MDLPEQWEDQIVLAIKVDKRFREHQSYKERSRRYQPLLALRFQRPLLPHPPPVIPPEEPLQIRWSHLSEQEKLWSGSAGLCLYYSSKAHFVHNCPSKLGRSYHLGRIEESYMGGIEPAPQRNPHRFLLPL